MQPKTTFKTVLTAGLLACSLALTALAQTSTNSPSSFPLLDPLTTGSNYFGGGFMTMATGDHTVGGGVFLGYKATDYLAPVLRLDEFGGQAYLANLSLQLSVPKTLMGKVPLVPMVVAGAGIPLTSATIDNTFTISAGQPVGIVGAGFYVPFDWMGSSWFAKNCFMPFTYEHWTGAHIPAKQQNQLRLGLGVSF